MSCTGSTMGLAGAVVATARLIGVGAQHDWQSQMTVCWSASRCELTIGMESAEPLPAPMATPPSPTSSAPHIMAFPRPASSLITESKAEQPRHHTVRTAVKARVRRADRESRRFESMARDVT